MNTHITAFFIKENEAWSDLLLRHRNEIPKLEEMLQELMDGRSFISDHTQTSLSLLRSAMQIQAGKMDEIMAQLKHQTAFLVKEQFSNEQAFSIHSLSQQNLLREQIRTVERAYIDLKCNLLNYLSTVV